jgi:hypothetical protein
MGDDSQKIKSPIRNPEYKVALKPPLATTSGTAKLLRPRKLMGRQMERRESCEIGVLDHPALGLELGYHFLHVDCIPESG